MSFFLRQLKRAALLSLFISAVLSTYVGITDVSLYQLKESILGSRQNFVNEATTEMVKKKAINELSSSIEPNSLNDGTTDIITAMTEAGYPTKEVVATGYTAGVESTGKTEDHPQYGITFSGVEVKRDLYSTVAADPEVFPIGTILFIPEYGYGVVADTGSAIKGDKLDLYYETVDDVFNLWGKKTVEIFIIEEGEGFLSEEMLETLNEAEEVQGFREHYPAEKTSKNDAY